MTPDEILFVDDAKGNIEVAKKVGINAVVYSELEELRRRIRIVLKNGI